MKIIKQIVAGLICFLAGCSFAWIFIDEPPKPGKQAAYDRLLDNKLDEEYLASHAEKIIGVNNCFVNISINRESVNVLLIVNANISKESIAAFRDTIKNVYHINGKVIIRDNNGKEY